MTITEEDVKRFEEAKTCKGCLGWHKYCKAECCKTIELNIDPKLIDKSKTEYLVIRINRNMSPSDQYYYMLHDVRYTRNTLRFRKDRLKVIGRKVYYFYKCNLLDENNLCKGHPNNKPELCKKLTLETSNIKKGGYMLTDNCLFKYKMKGGR